MRKKKNVITQNFLECFPLRHPDIKWSQDDEGKVSLHIENKGVLNTIMQKLFARPRISYVHLDKTGSFLWPLMDGEKDIITLGKLLEEAYGEETHPLYERLAKYIQILESYHFIIWKE